LRTAQNHDNQN